jgi:hypothetical protein
MKHLALRELPLETIRATTTRVKPIETTPIKGKVKLIEAILTKGQPIKAIPTAAIPIRLTPAQDM